MPTRRPAGNGWQCDQPLDHHHPHPLLHTQYKITLLKEEEEEVEVEEEILEEEEVGEAEEDREASTKQTSVSDAIQLAHLKETAA
jgi:hypothetical protein